MKRFIAGLVLLFLLAACSSATPEGQPESGFSFAVDPSAGTVKVATAEGIGTQQTEGRRTLVPGQDLDLISASYAFLPGNVLVIEADFKNISDQTFTDLTFSRSSDSNVVSSSEPAAVDELKPGESTGPLRFEVRHRGQGFTYEVVVEAVVEGSDGAEACSDPVNIPDDVLRNELRKQLQLPADSEITCSDLASLTEFSYEDIDFFILDLEGLQYAVNLTVLEIIDGSLDDISQVSSLTKLTTLNLSLNVRISDVTPVGNLLNLEFLDLSGNAVGDISPLGNLTNLEYLGLSNNDVRDISPLSGLPELRELDFNNNAALEDYSPLQNLPNLQVLDLSNRFFTEEDSKLARHRLFRRSYRLD